MIRLFSLFATLVMIAAAPARAEIIVTTEQALSDAAKASEGDAVIYVEAGRYDLSDLKLSRDIKLIGRGDVVFYSTSPTEKGILNPLPGVSLHVENIAFEGARSPDLNGAGIRHDGADLTIVNCLFNNNENGVLSTGTEDGRISITGTSFHNSGHGDGYSHGIYVVRAASLEIKSSAFIGTRVGHHVKSLAAKTIITGSLFDDANGETSYAVDVSRGGDVTITGNRIIQSVNAGNTTIINYDLTRGGDATALVITGNQFINRRANGNLLRNPTTLDAVIENNQFRNEGRGSLQYP